MVGAGYRRFKIVEGRFVHKRFGEYLIRAADGTIVPYSFPEGTATGPFGDDLPGPWLDCDAVFRYFSQFGLGWKDLHASL